MDETGLYSTVQAVTTGATVLAQIHTHQNTAKQNMDVWSLHAAWPGTQYVD